MRYFLLILATLAGCGGSEAIREVSSPIGCWQSSTGELDLMGNGTWRQTFDESATTDNGTWSYDAGHRQLALSIASASSSSGQASSTWQVTDLTATVMSTEVGSASTQWGAIACQLPVCADVATITACAGHATDGRPCAVCSNASGPVTECHAFRDAAQGTGVSGPPVTADYECVASCDSCE